jgi:diphosphomevalonate decarboxylase
MQRTVETSPLLQHRLTLVPKRMDDISEAIRARDFESFAKITMMDSNNFHACCLDTSPPIFYLNDVSKAIIAVVEEINRASTAAGRGLIAGYTFDAGPNAVIYALDKWMPTIIATINRIFPQETAFTDRLDTFAGKSIDEQPLLDGFDSGVVKVGGWEKGAVKSLIHTKVGDGPRRLGKEESLLNGEGIPKVLA